MLHNSTAHVDSRARRVTRLWSLRLTLVVAAIAATPALVTAGPVPPVPPLPSPAPQPQPQPQPQPSPPQGPAPGTDDSTYTNSGQTPSKAPPLTPTTPFAYSGPSGRVRLGGIWAYRSDPGNTG